MATLKEILAAKAKVGGVVIKAEDEKKKLAASIKETMDGLAPKIQPPAPQPRELGATTEGEKVPLSYPEPNSPRDDSEWFQSMHAFQSDLCIVLDPSGGTAWIGVKRSKYHPFPLLLHNLPIFPLPSHPF